MPHQASRPARAHRLLLTLALLLLWGAVWRDGPFGGASQAAPATQGAPQGALRPPAVLAKSAYVLDVQTGAPLFQKFPTTQLKMASTAKLMTGLLVAESGRLDEVATVSRRAATIGETAMGLAEGERVVVLDLLYGLLLHSGNDAAVVLAEHLAGSVGAFVEEMNRRAAALGLADTRYATPHGLDHASFQSLVQHSSARDLAVLGAVAMANPVFARAAGTTMRDVAAPSGKGPHRLRHTVSALWWYPGALGGKSGWTARAGQVRVIVAERGAPAATGLSARGGSGAVESRPAGLTPGVPAPGGPTLGGPTLGGPTLGGSAGSRLVAVVMDSPDHVLEIRDLLDYGFAVVGQSAAPRAPTAGTGPAVVATSGVAPSGIAPSSLLIPLSAEAFPLPEAGLARAWERYKGLALEPYGRIRRGRGGEEAASDAQAAALLHAVWFRDRPAFDAIWSWTKTALSRRQPHPANPHRDALFAGRWAHGEVVDWANSTAADQRLGAALLLASKLWNEPAYALEAKPLLDAVLNKAAISWQNTGVPAPTLGVPAANSSLKEIEPVTTSAATLTPAFYRMFAEGARNATWLSLLDGTYLTLERALASAGPLGPGSGLLPSWFSVSRQDGRVGEPIDPSWQSTGFGQASPALAWQLALDLRWHNDARSRTLLVPTARLLGRDLAQRRQIAAAYARGGGAAPGAETSAYGALAGIGLAEVESGAGQPSPVSALRAKLEPGLTSPDPDRILDAIDGLWLLAGGPPNYWRIWWPPEDLPTTRNDAVVPPATGNGVTWRYFGQTGHVVQGRFLDFFQARGGVDIFGLPRTDELSEDGRQVQYFQRARLEYSSVGYAPERAASSPATAASAASAPSAEVSITALGTRAAQTRGILSRTEAQPLPPLEGDETRTYVPETGHSLVGGFRDFYHRAGGAAVLGFPLTEELVEDGFTVQYFERAVLEYVPG
ncbi:MAG: glycosyl hydrolase family 8, partial [Chloroflexota bacterium]|nr:glycosyl hydrolase family 8 [Chloroflexota bacterium]